jgi:hypothetical protein
MDEKISKKIGGFFPTQPPYRLASDFSRSHAAPPNPQSKSYENQNIPALRPHR